MANIPEFKVVTPHAAAIIWNYRDRIGPNGVQYGIDTIDQKIISTLSLISVRTAKSKSAPSGSFAIELAPTKDWTSFLTAGSWMCLMMSQKPFGPDDFKTADPDKVKFFGRIDSVRVDVKVDQETGARKTVYSVIGNDWAQIFNTVLYVDPVARENQDPNGRGTSEVGVANRMLYNKYVDEMSRGNGLPTSSQNIRALVNLWGTTNSYFKEARDIANNGNVVVKPDVAFALPKEVFNFFNFNSRVSGSRKIVDILQYKNGVLYGYDSYKELNESVGVVKPDSILGSHTMWQVLNDNSNNVLNELVTDIRWNDSGQPELTLYNRIRPFCIRKTSDIVSGGPGGKTAAPFIKNLISRFQNVRRVEIPIENVVTFNAGTNWRDKYNYIEIQLDKQLLDDVRSSQVKVECAIFSSPVFSREGFRPMIVPTKYMVPLADSSYDVFSTVQWKYLLKEWYFDTHNLLNGTMTFVGIDDYIQVGDNIIVDASVLGKTNNTNRDNLNNKDSSFLLGHVESVSHSFSVDPESAARSYFTTVTFVRGIITDADGKQFNDGRIQVDASSITPSEEKNSANVFATSSALDPDTQVEGS